MSLSVIVLFLVIVAFIWSALFVPRSLSSINVEVELNTASEELYIHCFTG